MSAYRAILAFVILVFITMSAYSVGQADGRASVPLCGIERDTVYIARRYIMVYPPKED